MNTMSKEMNMGVLVALEIAAQDETVSVIVLTGSGTRAFCAGGNLQADDSGQSSASAGMRQTQSGIPPTAFGAVRNLRISMNSSWLLRNISKPTICAVNGACAGAGFSWACACDLRFASENSVFRAGFLTAGLSGDYGGMTSDFIISGRLFIVFVGTWTLPRIVGPAKAREIYMLNQKIRAPDAKAMGLVSDVFPVENLMEQVMKVAVGLAAAPQLALKRIKMNLNDADRVLSFSEALDIESERHARTGYHPDAMEAGIAFIQKRKPQFMGISGVEAWHMSKL
jgi:2-(1,2-epoxy-1,2-dihydrophenyl)acetyl-CoA isomerase